MEVIILDIAHKLCGTCQHWDGARQKEMGIRVRCLKESDGVCLVRQQEKRNLLDTIQPCHGGFDCPNWLGMELPPIVHGELN